MVTLAGAVLASLLFGCANPVTPPVAGAMPPLHRAALAGERGATVRATFQLAGRRLQHTAGAPALTSADLDAVTLYLVEAPIGAPPDGELSAVSGSGFTYALDASNRSRSQVDVFFTNVPANAPGMAYFLAVTATGGGIDITNAAAPATLGGRRCYVSDGGGNPAAPGSVRVASGTYVLDAETPLVASLKLGDASAAALGASVTVSDGG